MQLRAPSDTVSSNAEARHNKENSRRFGTLPLKKIRPLGTFSDYICDELGAHNQLVREAILSPGKLFEIAERRLSEVPDGTFSDLLYSGISTPRRVALLDLVWMLRSLDIAHSSSCQYIERRNQCQLYDRARSLAHKERRNPALSWSDIAIYHPANDPRSFLAPGSARDQEILMYRVQGAIEETFKQALRTDWSKLTVRMASELVVDLNVVLKGMVHLSKVRSIGQFYQLDPFLGPNDRYRGHATGAFSAWTFLMGIFLSGNSSFARRICDNSNRLAFDCDAIPYIEEVKLESFKKLREFIDLASFAAPDKTRVDDLFDEALNKFSLFLHSHRGAMKRHAEGSFGDPSPSDPVQTNGEVIKEAIAGMRFV
jgi:hypothetical protein